MDCPLPYPCSSGDNGNCVRGMLQMSRWGRNFKTMYEVQFLRDLWASLNIGRKKSLQWVTPNVYIISFDPKNTLQVYFGHFGYFIEIEARSEKWSDRTSLYRVSEGGSVGLWNLTWSTALCLQTPSLCAYLDPLHPHSNMLEGLKAQWISHRSRISERTFSLQRTIDLIPWITASL